MARGRAMHFLPFVISISDPLWDFVKDVVYEYVWPVAIILNNLKERTRVDITRTKEPLLHMFGVYTTSLHLRQDLAAQYFIRNSDNDL